MRESYTDVQREPSLSARRAWIEMVVTPDHQLHRAVALRKESVDRNSGKAVKQMGAMGRSPQGERG